MKITDFLEMNNKPKEFKYKNYIWKQPEGMNIYLNEASIDFETYLASVQICDLGRSFTEVLNDEIEIIEDAPKGIELLDIKFDGYNTYYLLNEYGTKCTLSKHDKIIAEQQNEIAKAVNYLLKRCDKDEC